MPSDLPAPDAAAGPPPFDWAAIQDRIAAVTQGYAASGATAREDAAEVAARLMRLHQAASARKG